MSGGQVGWEELALNGKKKRGGEKRRDEFA